jgi:hypothetical protein
MRTANAKKKAASWFLYSCLLAMTGLFFGLQAWSPTADTVTITCAVIGNALIASAALGFWRSFRLNRQRQDAQWTVQSDPNTETHSAFRHDETSSIHRDASAPMNSDGTE